MQISVKGKMTLAELKQALYEKLGELEDEFAIAYSRGATLYVNPVDDEGEAVLARRRGDGKHIKHLISDGPYRSAADKNNI